MVNIGANPRAQVMARALGWPLADGLGAAGAESILNVDDEDVGLDVRDVREAIKLVVPAMAKSAMARYRGRVEAEVIELSEIDNFDPLTNPADAAMLADPFRTATRELVVQQFNRLRGRVD